MTQRRIVSQSLRPNGVWTTYDDGTEILKDYDDNGVSLDPNNEIFTKSNTLGVFLDSDQRTFHFSVAGTQRPNLFL